MDQETGIGAYKIGGGDNGGFFDLGVMHGSAIAVLLLGLLVPGVAPLLLSVLLIVLTASLLAMAVVIAEDGSDDAINCFKLGMYVGFDGIFIMLGAFLPIAKIRLVVTEIFAMLLQAKLGANTLGQCNRDPL